MGSVHRERGPLARIGRHGRMGWGCGRARPRSWREHGPLARIWSIQGEWIGECGRAARGPFQGAKPPWSIFRLFRPSRRSGGVEHDPGGTERRGRITAARPGGLGGAQPFRRVARRWNVSRSQKFLFGCSATAPSRRGTATCRSSWPTSRWRAGPPLAPRVQGGGDRGGRRLTAAQAHHGDARKTPCRKGDIPELEKGDTSIRVDTSCRGVDISACSPYVSPDSPSTGFLHDPKRRRVVARQP